MSRMNIEKAEVAKRFAKAHQSYGTHAIAQQNICKHLIALMQVHLDQNMQLSKFKRIFEIGCGAGYLTQLLHHHFQIQHIYLNDLYVEVEAHFDHTQIAAQVEWCIGDAEKITFPNALDLIVSSSALQWMTDLDLLFSKCRHALITSGYLCFSTFGQGNLKEIKALTGQGLDYIDSDDLRQKLEHQGFEVIQISEQYEQLLFEHPKQVLQHLKATGVTATAQKHRWTKQSLTQFYLDYQKFSHQNEQGQQHYQLTYHPIYVIARKKTQ